MVLPPVCVKYRNDSCSFILLNRATVTNIRANGDEGKKLHGKLELIEQRRLQFQLRREERDGGASGSGKYLIKKEKKKQ